MDAHDFDWNDNYTGKASDHEPPDPLMLEILDALPPGRALDIGCGAGGLVVALAERGWRVTGVDVAGRAIEAARAVAKERGLEVELQVADATTWHPSGHYDLVTNSFALPGDKDRQSAVFAMARAALSPGGTLLLKDFDSTMTTEHPVFSTFHLPTVEELTNAFEGFEILRAEVVETPAHDHDGTGAHAGERWTAALLHARKPS